MRNFRTISGSDDKKNNDTKRVETWIRGPTLLDDPYLNKGISFTIKERKSFLAYIILFSFLSLEVLVC
jgi:hypothetical protein